MSDSYCVLIYSKFSPNSKKVLDIIESCPFDLKKLINFEMLCIDNENVRKTIVKSKDIKVAKVPAILVVQSDGVIESFVGSKVFEWLKEVLLKLETEKEAENQKEIQRQQEIQLLQQQLTFHQQRADGEAREKARIHAQLQAQIQAQAKALAESQEKAFSRPVKEPPPDKIPTKGRTSLSELKADDGSDFKDLKRTPAPIRSGSNSYEFSDFGEDIIDVNTNRQTDGVGRAIKEVENNGIKKKDIVSEALAMQKSREMDSVLPPRN